MYRKLVSIAVLLTGPWIVANEAYVQSYKQVIQTHKQYLTSEEIIHVEYVQSVVKSLRKSFAKRVERLHAKITTNSVQEFLEKPSDKASLHAVQTACVAKLYQKFLQVFMQEAFALAYSIDKSLHYWRHEQFLESQKFYKKNIMRWFHTWSYQKQVKKHVTALQGLQKRIFYALGVAFYNQELIYAALSQESFEDIFMKTKLFSQDTFDVAEFTLYTKLLQAHVSAKQVLESTRQEYMVCKQPNHVLRNWTWYGAGAVSTVVAAYVLYAYQDQFALWKEKFLRSSHRFYKDQIEEPIYNLKQSFFEPEETKLNPPEFKQFDLEEKGPIVTIEPFDTKQVQDDWYELMKYDLKEKAEAEAGWVNYIKGREITDADVEKLMEDQTITKGVDVEKLKTWLFGPNAAVRAVVRQFLVLKKDGLDRANDIIEVLKRIDDDLELNKIKHNINELMNAVREGIVMLEAERKDQKLNLQIASLFPASVVLYGAWSMMQGVYHTVFTKKLSHGPIKKVMRALEKFLNESINEDVSFEKEGQLQFLIHRLQTVGRILPISEEALFEEDVMQLARKDLTYAQKYNVIQHMYHTYAFLLPRAV